MKAMRAASPAPIAAAMANIVAKGLARSGNGKTPPPKPGNPGVIVKGPTYEGENTTVRYKLFLKN